MSVQYDEKNPKSRPIHLFELRQIDALLSKQTQYLYASSWFSCIKKWISLENVKKSSVNFVYIFKLCSSFHIFFLVQLDMTRFLSVNQFVKKEEVQQVFISKYPSTTFLSYSLLLKYQ